LGTLYKFEHALEERRGALGTHILERYRDLMLRFADPSNTDLDVVRMREKAKSIPALLARALDREVASQQPA
jgi:hypothetical protein